MESNNAHGDTVRSQKSKVNGFRLLDSIGSTRIQQEIERRVEIIVILQREALAKQTGIQPSFTEEDDMKEYLDKVVKEVIEDKNTLNSIP
jgi:hypothetical protein